MGVGADRLPEGSQQGVGAVSLRGGGRGGDLSHSEIIVVDVLTRMGTIASLMPSASGSGTPSE